MIRINKDAMCNVMGQYGGWIERATGYLFRRVSLDCALNCNHERGKRPDFVSIAIDEIDKEAFLIVPSVNPPYLYQKFISMHREQLAALLVQYDLEKNLNDVYPVFTKSQGQLYSFEHDIEFCSECTRMMEENGWVEDLYDEFQMTDGINRVVINWCQSKNIELF